MTHRAKRIGSLMLRSTLIAGAALLCTLSSSTAAIRGLYVGSEFYPPSTNSETIAKNSGFNRLFLFTSSVEPNGDITFQGNTLVSNGVYVGNSTWNSRLMSVKNDGRIERIELCIGSWGSPAFDRIRDLVASQGTGSSSILYRNFQALKNAVGAITAIQYDDESTYHASSAGAFGQMLAGLGYKVTLCPYNWNTRTFWQSVKSQVGANCDTVYLQCYDGGAGNNPASWNSYFGGLKVTPGLWGNTSGPTAVISQFRAWDSAGVCNGGFMWLNGVLQWDTDVMGQCMTVALEKAPDLMFVNKNSGKCINLVGGSSANGTDIVQNPYNSSNAENHWQILPSPNNHFRIISAKAGKSFAIVSNSTANGADLNLWTYQPANTFMEWDILHQGDGWYVIHNVGSGKVLEVEGSSTADGVTISQNVQTNSANQLFRLQPVGDYYVKTTTGPNNYLCVQGGTGENGRDIVQWTKQNETWFKFRLSSNTEGWQRISSLVNLSRSISVTGQSTANKAVVEYWDSGTRDDQKIRVDPLTNGRFKFHFKHSDKVFDIPVGSSVKGKIMEQYTDSAYTWQEFELERIP